MLRIMIADDHAAVRTGVRSIIEAHSGWEVCAEASDGQEALELALRHSPDLVILDISMLIANGLAVTRKLRQLLPGTSVLLFSMHDDDETIAEGLAAGARGYLLKTESADSLEVAINAMGAGRPYFSPEVSELLLASAAGNRKRPRLQDFTIRELEVAQLIAEGLSNKHIARRLERSIKTIEAHRASAMRKAGVHSAAELVRFAIKQNMIQA